MTAMQEFIESITGNGLIRINQTLIDGALKQEKQQIFDAAQYTLEQGDIPRKGSLNDFFEEVYDEIIKKSTE